MPQISITDIAAIAGVAPSTVSRALQDDPRISQARRAAIKALAERMGYRPSLVARSLVTGRTRTLGVVVTDVTDPFVAEVMKGAESASRQAGYTLLFAMSNRDPDREVEALQLLVDRQADGMIVISGRAGARYAEVHRSASGGEPSWPLVLVNNDQLGMGIYNVRLDNRAAAREAVAYLGELGHRRIAFVAGPEHGRSGRERLDGYMAGMAALAGGATAARVWPGAGLPEDGEQAVTGLRKRRQPPTAVLCYNDLCALGVLAAAARLGIAVPGELSVIGFDNIPLSAYSIPPLTTVDQPKAFMGSLAVSMCLQALAGLPVEPAILRGQLVVRGSTSAPGSQAG